MPHCQGDAHRRTRGGARDRKALCGGGANFTRTVNRHDFSLEPPKDTILDMLKAAGKDVIGVGKIYDIFAGKGLTKTFPNEGNEKNMDVTISLLDEDFEGLCFVNLVDFDMMYGHRNDVKGYTDALNAFDKRLDEFLPKMRKDDVLMITADHGCDPDFRELTIQGNMSRSSAAAGR